MKLEDFITDPVWQLAYSVILIGIGFLIALR